MFTPLFSAGQYAFSVYSLIVLATSLAAGLFGMRVVQHDQGSRISWRFLVVTASMSGWLMGRAMCSASLDPEVALIWARISYAAFPFLPVGFLQFTWAAIGREKKPLALLIASRSIGVLLSVLSVTTPWIIAGVLHYPWGFYPRYGRGGIAVAAFFVLQGIGNLHLLLSTIRRLRPSRRRSRLQWFAAAYAVGCVGMIDFVAAYGIPLLPLGHLAALALLLIAGTAIRKFQLFDLTPAFAARNILSTMQDGLIVADDEGHVRIVNDALCRLTGYAREEALNCTVADLLTVPPVGDAALRSRGGESIPVSVSVSPLEDGEVRVGTVTIAHDMRERRRIESAMLEHEMRLRTEEVRRRAELQYRTLVESMSEGIVQVDGDNVVRYVNDSALAMTGARRDDLLGNDIGEVFDGSFRAVFDRDASAPTRSAVELRTKGAPRWIEVVRSPLTEASGKTIGLMGVLTDITERRSFEQQLAISERAWRETFDAIQIPMVIVDGNGFVQRANRAARERGRDVVGVPVGEFGAGALWREIERLTREGSAGHVQYEEAETASTWDIVIDVATDDSGNRQFVVVARDISAFVALQQSLHRSERMSALGALVGGVAHEVRNPLFVISSTLDVFERVHGERPELERFIRVLREQVGRVSDLMSGLLDFGRPAPVRFVRGGVPAIAEKAIELCEASARAAGVTISCHAAEDLPLVDMDERRLLQAFRNVVENAVQHSPAGGTVDVRLEHAMPSGGVLCSVADDGLGFAPADVAHVFEPFFTRRKGGTGLGLSITRSIVEQHRGTVLAGNRPEGGALISLSLPSAVTDATRRSDARAPVPA